MATDAQLKLADETGALVPLQVATDADNTATGRSLPVVDYAVRLVLDAIRTAVEGVLDVNGPLTNAELRAAPVEVTGEVSSSPDTTTHAHLVDIKRGVTDGRTLIDWDANGQPRYVGVNVQSAAGSAGDWSIKRITWDANGQPTDVQVLVGAWDNRESLAWSS